MFTIEDRSKIPRRLSRQLTADMKREIDRILTRGGTAIYFAIMVDIDYVAQDKLFLGCSPWGEEFAAAFRSGSISCIIDGSALTAGSLKMIDEVLAMNRAGRAPLNIWVESNSRRLLLKPDTVRVTPNSLKVTHASYHYEPQLPNYDWDEAAVKLAVGIQQEKAYGVNNRSDSSDRFTEYAL